MLATLIQGYMYNKISFHFCSSSRMRDKLKFYRLLGAIFYDRSSTLNTVEPRYLELVYFELPLISK